MLAKSQSADKFDIQWIQKDVQCWVHFPMNEHKPLFQKAVIKGIIPLAYVKGNSKVMVQLQNGDTLETKASNLEKRRHSNSIQKDLISLQTINGAQILDQLKRRLELRKIHIYLWNSLIIVNPFVRIEGMYSEQIMKSFTHKIFYQKRTIQEIEPHIYGFVCNILNQLRQSSKVQFISISGESGSGKTETNKQCLKIISHVCEAHLKNNQLNNALIEQRILNCDYIIECFGNAKTEKNDNSSRFGKLITEKINIKTMQIAKCEIRGFFLEKSRIVHQFDGERNFHIFYQLLDFCDQHSRQLLGLKHKNMQNSFAYLRYKNQSAKFDQQMWQNLQNAFDVLQFDHHIILQIYQTLAAILHLGNLRFDDHSQNDHDPCQIVNDELIPLISNLLMINPKQLIECLIFHKKILAGETMYLPMSQKQCIEGRDSMAKALYQNLFLWIIEQLTNKVNEETKDLKNIRQIKMLDIYGFQVFQYNSFEQLNVNYTNQRIHQVYLNQVFKYEKTILEKEGLGSSIPNMKFTDNKKIIDMLDMLPKSIYNLLDESCSLNMRDDDYLNNIKRTFDGYEYFPPKNNISTKKVFILQHTPGMIEYHTEGFRAKNKDFLRQDIMQNLSKSKIFFIKSKFLQQIQKIRNQQNKKFLGFKIRKQVSALISEMSNQSDLHFIRCIKPNQQKKPLTFIDKVCYNQIKYLGILDTIMMRKDSYHVRMNYIDFYKKYGILNRNVKQMIQIEKGKISFDQCKNKTKKFLDNNFKANNLDYLYGNTKLFMKMETHNFFQTTLKKRMADTNYSCTIIKTIWRFRKNRNKNLNYTVHIKKVQKTVRSYLRDIYFIKRKNAVRIIQRQWIKRCDQYFRRKKRLPLMVLQKRIKTLVWKRQNNLSISQMKTGKQILLSLSKSHRQANKFQRFVQFKKMFLSQIYNRIWENMKHIQAQKIQRYCRTFRCQRNNYKKIQLANQKAKIKLIIRSQNTISKYLKSIQCFSWFQSFQNAVIKIQRNYRMAKCRQNFNDMRHKVVFIQEQWRRYKYNKIESHIFTNKYFNSVKKIQHNLQQPLFRSINQNVNGRVDGFERIIDKFQKIKKQKMVLFYYLLDLQVLTSDISIEKWTNNYLNLSQQSFQKLNPLQAIDVSNSHTTCVNINKAYSWGCIDLHNNHFHTERSYPIQQHYIQEGKINKFSIRDDCICINTINPQNKYYIGQEHKDQSHRQWSTLCDNFVLINGTIITVSQISLIKMDLPEKVSQISCGMGHIIIKTILKKVYTWGNNEHGQLGHGDFCRIIKYSPRMVQFFYKKKIQAMQVAAGANCSLVIDSNSKIYWFGTNGTIRQLCVPEQCQLINKSVFLGNASKYCPIRIIARWSKTMSIIGVTMASYDNLFKHQISLRRKIIENLMNKWNQDISTINPPYVQSLASYIAQKHMPLPSQKVQSSNKSNISNKEVRDKIISEITMIEQSQRDLLKQKHLKNMSNYSSKYKNSKPY